VAGGGWREKTKEQRVVGGAGSELAGAGRNANTKGGGWWVAGAAKLAGAERNIDSKVRKRRDKSRRFSAARVGISLVSCQLSVAVMRPRSLTRAHGSEVR
jgi:hypothetical protein